MEEEESWQDQRITRRPVWLKGIKLNERINGGCALVAATLRKAVVDKASG